MEIITSGYGKGSFSPDEVQINLYFKESTKKYEEALQKGISSINNFQEVVLVPLGFHKEDLKTINMIVNEEKQYDNKTNSYQILGYLFQSDALLKFPYDKDLLALYLKQLSTLERPPYFTLNFSLKNDDYSKKLIEMAYQDALNKASVIANTVNKKIKDVLRASFEPMNMPLSRTSFNNEQMMLTSSKNIDTFILNLTPLDILIEVTINYLFLAE